ncbi:MAG: hypothetical protein JSR82_10910 [Verrucomicrobia bacterium]|nr:hypothetical protein [Verrucomicrobiota bacterium]
MRLFDPTVVRALRRKVQARLAAQPGAAVDRPPRSQERRVSSKRLALLQLIGFPVGTALYAYFGAAQPAWKELFLFAFVGQLTALHLTRGAVETLALRRRDDVLRQHPWSSERVFHGHWQFDRWIVVALPLALAAYWIVRPEVLPGGLKLIFVLLAVALGAPAMFGFVLLLVSFTAPTLRPDGVRVRFGNAIWWIAILSGWTVSSVFNAATDAPSPPLIVQVVASFSPAGWVGAGSLSAVHGEFAQAAIWLAPALVCAALAPLLYTRLRARYDLWLKDVPAPSHDALMAQPFNLLAWPNSTPPAVLEATPAAVASGEHPALRWPERADWTRRGWLEALIARRLTAREIELVALSHLPGTPDWSRSWSRGWLWVALGLLIVASVPRRPGLALLVGGGVAMALVLPLLLGRWYGRPPVIGQGQIRLLDTLPFDSVELATIYTKTHLLRFLALLPQLVIFTAGHELVSRFFLTHGWSEALMLGTGLGVSFGLGVAAQLPLAAHGLFLWREERMVGCLPAVALVSLVFSALVLFAFPMLVVPVRAGWVVLPILLSCALQWSTVVWLRSHWWRGRGDLIGSPPREITG